jgi:hypothetical protein
MSFKFLKKVWVKLKKDLTHRHHTSDPYSTSESCSTSDPYSTSESLPTFIAHSTSPTHSSGSESHKIDELCLGAPVKVKKR